MELTQLLDSFINENLIDIIISNPKNKSEDKASKIKVRPVMLQNSLNFQATSYIGNQVFHENYDFAGIKASLTEWIVNGYKQAQFSGKDAAATVLSGKKAILQLNIKKSRRLSVYRRRFPTTGPKAIY